MYRNLDFWLNGVIKYFYDGWGHLQSGQGQEQKTARPEDIPNPGHHRQRILHVLQHVVQGDQIEGFLLQRQIQELARMDLQVELPGHGGNGFGVHVVTHRLPAPFPSQAQQVAPATDDVQQAALLVPVVGVEVWAPAQRTSLQGRIVLEEGRQVGTGGGGLPIAFVASAAADPYAPK